METRGGVQKNDSEGFRPSPTKPHIEHFHHFQYSNLPDYCDLLLSGAGVGAEGRAIFHSKWLGFEVRAAFQERLELRERAN